MDAQRARARLSSTEDIHTQRTPWIIGGTFLVAALVAAFTLVTPRVDAAGPQPGDESADVVVDDTQGRSQDRAAQAELRNAMAAALSNFVEADTYTGWDPESAAGIEPSLEWAGDGRAEVGKVSVNYAGGDQVIMSTMSESGQAFCVANDAASGAGTLFGRTDLNGVANASACAGGW